MIMWMFFSRKLFRCKFFIGTTIDELVNILWLLLGGQRFLQIAWSVVDLNEWFTCVILRVLLAVEWRIFYFKLIK